MGLLAVLVGTGASGVTAAPAETPPAGVIHVDPLPPGEGAGGASAGATLDDATWTGIAGERNGALDDRVPCIGNGTAGERVEVIYARPSNVATQYATMRDPIRALVSNLNREFAASAGETRGRRQLRVVTDGFCDVIVNNAVLSTDSSVTEFNTLVSDLTTQGYNNPKRVYLVYLDGDVSSNGQSACGVGGGAIPPYAIIADSCWSDVDDHELLHAFGAVPPGAPHASLDGHCTDGWDPLCGVYDYGPPTMACPYWHHGLPDCRHDDYFHTNPKNGSYLDKNPARNVANSPFLDKALPPLNDAFDDAQPAGIGVVWGSNVGAGASAAEPHTAGSAPAHSTWFKITTPASQTLQVETSASSVDTVLGVYTGTAVNNLVLVKQNDDANNHVRYSRVRIPTTATTYYVRVDGKDGKVGSIRLNVLLGTGLPKLTGMTPQRSKFGEVHFNGENLFCACPGGSIFTFDGRGYAAYGGSDATGVKLTPNTFQHPGPVTFTNDKGHVVSDDAYELKPDIHSFSPASGNPGTTVLVKGTGLVSRIVPKFAIGGKPAKVKSVALVGGADGWHARIKVPAGATDGRITVKTAIAGDASGSAFNVTS